MLSVLKMKLLISLLLLISNLLYSQEAYILTTEGEKIRIDAGEHFYDSGRKIKYYSGNAVFPKTIKTEKVKEIIDGQSIYRVYAFDDKKQELHLYKVVATAPDKTLLIQFIEPPANASSGGLGMRYFIVSGSNQVLASGEIPPLPPSRISNGKDIAIEDIMRYFGDCTTLRANFGKGSVSQPDGTEKSFTENIPLGFKVQKGIHQCN